MHDQYVVRTGGFFDHRFQETEIGGIELTWHDDFWELPDELRPQGMPTSEHYRPIYEQKLVIERSKDCPGLTVTFSEGLDRRLNAPHFQYAEEKGWPFNKEALFAATDHTQTWTHGSQIRLTSGQWGKTTNEMQLVRQGAHGEEIVTISDRFRLINDMKSQLAQRLTQGLQLHHAVVDEYTVV
jgi:hypothetical protein